MARKRSANQEAMPRMPAKPVIDSAVAGPHGFSRGRVAVEIRLERGDGRREIGERRLLVRVDLQLLKPLRLLHRLGERGDERRREQRGDEDRERGQRQRADRVAPRHRRVRRTRSRARRGLRRTSRASPSPDGRRRASPSRRRRRRRSADTCAARSAARWPETPAGSQTATVTIGKCSQVLTNVQKANAIAPMADGSSS